MTRSASSSAPPADDADHPGPDRMGVSGSQVAASVLASTSAAVVASFFGVAGTVIGAAVVSVVATVGTAAYGLGIRRTKARLVQVQALRLGRTEAGQEAAASRVDEGVPDAADPEPAAADPVMPEAAVDAVDAGPTGWWHGFARHRWSLAAGVALVLVLSLGAVSLLEVVTDGPLAGGTSGGRTSIGALFRGDDDDGGESDDGGSGGQPPATTVPAEGAPAPTTEPGAGASTTTTEAGRATTTTTPERSASTTTSTTAPPSTTTTTAPSTPSTTAPPPPDPPSPG